MRFLVAFALLAVVSADVSHLNLPEKEYLPPVSSVAQLPLSGSLPSSEYLPPVRQTYHQPAPVYTSPLVSTHYTSVPSVSTHYSHGAVVPGGSYAAPHYTTSHYTAPQYQTYALPQYQSAHYHTGSYHVPQYQVPQYQTFQQYTAPVVSTYQPEPVPAHTFGADGYSYKDPRY